MLKRIMLSIPVLLLICLIGLTGIPQRMYLPASVGGNLRQTIILDAGHGGFDGGAVAFDGTVEKEINLNIASCLGEFLRYNGFEVIMTRTGDTGTDDTGSASSISSRKKNDLQNRLRLMNQNPDAVFVSVHLNKFTTSAASGAQVFYSPNHEESALLGEAIQASVISLLQPENRRVIKKGTDSTFLLRKAEIPAVIVECGFISNKGELQKLKDRTYQRQMAFALCTGILDFFAG